MKAWWDGDCEKYVLHKEIDQHEYMRKKYHGRKKVVHLLLYCDTPEYAIRTDSEGTRCSFPFVEVVYKDEDYLLQIPDKVVAICGAPGMGKSALASLLCKKLKDNDNMRWVLHVNLPDKVKSLTTAVGADIAKQLATLCGVSSDGLESTLFERSVHTGVPFKTVIILDAYDEISEQPRIAVLELVKSIATTKVSQVFLVSRTVFKIPIQNATNAVALELAPFSYDDIVNYVAKHWMASGISNAPYEELHQCAKQVIEPYMPALGFPNTPLKIPLLSRIVAELEQTSFRNGSVTTDYKNVSMFKLYKRFAECKLQIYDAEKLQRRLNMLTVAAENDRYVKERHFYHALGVLAVNVVFCDKLLDLLTADEPKAPDQEDSLIREANSVAGHGIVDAFIDGSPRFIHKTVAEFFAAHFLFQKIKEAESVNARLITSVLELYFNEGYEEVTKFLDSFAAESLPLHLAIIHGSCVSLTQQEDVFKRDVFNRTLLHVAALHADLDTIEQFANVHVFRTVTVHTFNNLLMSEDKFGMTPMMYAQKVGGSRELAAIWNLIASAQDECLESSQSPRMSRKRQLT